jgi:hypothetical protein
MAPPGAGTDPKRPVVCFDESPTQLIGEVRQPIPAKPEQLERYDCDYRRNGTVILFVFLDARTTIASASRATPRAISSLGLRQSFRDFEDSVHGDALTQVPTVGRIPSATSAGNCLPLFSRFARANPPQPTLQAQCCSITIAI